MSVPTKTERLEAAWAARALAYRALMAALRAYDLANSVWYDADEKVHAIEREP